MMTNGEKFKDVFGFGADGSRVIAVNSTWWDCDFQIRKPKTNADRIRSMTDEELAMWINDVTTNALSVLALGSNKQTKNIFYWLDWLKEEVKKN